MKKQIITLFTVITVMVIISINSITVSAATQKRQLILTKKQYTFNVREDHSSKSTAIGKVSSKDFPLVVHGEEKDTNGTLWYKIKFGKENGWIISSKVLKLEEVSASKNTTSTTKKTSTKASTTTTVTKTTTTKATTKSKVVTKRIVPEKVTNFRKTPEKTDNVLFKWYEKDTPAEGVEILEEKVVSNTLWYKISLKNGKKKYSGWVDADAVTVVYPFPNTTTTKKTTTTSKTTITTKKTTSKSSKKESNIVFESSFSTRFVGGSEGRRINVNQACKDLNGTIIAPNGGKFNWFRVMPTTTAEHGYAKARVFSGGRSVQGFGGGLCQVSSTLYNACLNASNYVEVTERHPHGLPVSYVRAGRDATICRDAGLNFRFTNTSSYYLVINAYTGNSKCTVKITGYQNKP